MKTRIWTTITITLAATLLLFGTGYAGGYGDRVTLSGTINSNNQLIDSHGNAFRVGSSDAGLEVRSMIGKKVEVKGTVMDQGGQKTVEVHEYKILSQPWTFIPPDAR